MKYTLVFVALLFTADDPTKPLTFTKEHLGKLPPHWTVAKTGTGEGSVWKVTADESAPGKTGHALMQTAKSPNAMFNICVRDGSMFQDGELSVKVKAVHGDADQGGGLVWRYKDANNYYITRYNPLENNFRLYNVVDGKRIQLATKADLETPKDKWFTIVVTHKRDKIECSLNGVVHLKAEDNAFVAPGQVGFWTKADAQTMFDELMVTRKK
jgi:hypothetical protein